MRAQMESRAARMFWNDLQEEQVKSWERERGRQWARAGRRWAGAVGGGGGGSAP